MNNYYTYAYLREDGTPYYIGKGKGERIHSSIRSINLPPKERRIFLKQNLTEVDAFRHEVYMIDILGRKDLGTGILRNRTDGGEGCSGIVVSDNTRRKLRDVNIGNKNSKGYRWNDEQRKKLSMSLVGKKFSENHKKSLKEAWERRKVEKPITEETKRKISECSSRYWSITYQDGTNIIVKNLTQWSIDNGYSFSLLKSVKRGDRKRHKDIVAVQKLDKTP